VPLAGVIAPECLGVRADKFTFTAEACKESDLAQTHSNQRMGTFYVVGRGNSHDASIGEFFVWISRSADPVRCRS